MSRLLRIGFDIDGVLANFVHGFLTLVNRECGTNYTEADWVTYGGINGEPQPAFMTREQWDIGWTALKRTPSFWATLQPYPVDWDRLASRLDGMEFHGYFVTLRTDLQAGEGVNDAAWLTKAWLETQGLFEYSGVVASSKHKDRAGLLKAMEIDAYVDDWADQFQKCLDAGIDAYLLDRPYNRHVDTYRRVYSVEEYIDRAMLKHKASKAGNKIFSTTSLGDIPGYQVNPSAAPSISTAEALEASHLVPVPLQAFGIKPDHQNQALVPGVADLEKGRLVPVGDTGLLHIPEEAPVTP